MYIYICNVYVSSYCIGAEARFACGVVVSIQIVVYSLQQCIQTVAQYDQLCTTSVVVKSDQLCTASGCLNTTSCLLHLVASIRQVDYSNCILLPNCDSLSIRLQLSTLSSCRNTTSCLLRVVAAIRLVDYCIQLPQYMTSCLLHLVASIRLVDILLHNCVSLSI